MQLFLKQVVYYQKAVLYINQILIDNDIDHNNEKYMNEQEYETLKKSVISENIFSVDRKENVQIFQTARKYYKKLLAHCPLFNYQKQLNPPLLNTQKSTSNTFVTLDLARDNLNRAMRLKRIKHPLKNKSILKGISYVRQFFLKRLMLIKIEENYSKKKKLKENSFLIPNKNDQRILNELFKFAQANGKSEGIEMKHFINMNLNEKLEIGNPIQTTRKSRRSEESKIQIISLQDNLEVEIIQIDHSLFGELQLMRCEMVFIKKEKEKTNPKYRLGSPNEMYVNVSSSKNYVWKYCEIERIIRKQYNMIWQAIEILQKNKKSVFLVFFSEEYLEEFFNKFRKYVYNGKKQIYQIEFIENPKKEFINKRFTEEWKKKRLSNFEYLMRINDFSSRTFEDLSQYPVFPWILQNYQEKQISLNEPNYRDLRYPIAAITEKKRKMAKSKYDNTDDIPGGRFQFGSHYLPGLSVIGYLMRIQPFTLMSYRFNSGSDCPARHFHILASRWQSCMEETSNCIELIPEFYYNIEFLSNR